MTAPRSFIPSPHQEYTQHSICVYDFPFRLRTNHKDAAQLMTALYRHFVVPDVGEHSTEAILECDKENRFWWQLNEQAGTASSLAGALWSLEAALCETIIRSQRRSFAIHAATVLLENSAALLTGRSTAGKTTLSLALARRGFPVATDDVALVDPESLNVLPIPRCFHLDDAGSRLLEADGLCLPGSWRDFRFTVPSDFHEIAMTPRRARVLVFIQGPRGEHPMIEATSQAQMSAHVLSETGQGPLPDSETIAATCRLASGAACYLLRPGPLTETADALAHLLSQLAVQ